MKKFLSENWFKLIIVLLLIWFLVIIGTYLRDKNQIEAKTNRAECLHRAIEVDKSRWDQRTNICDNIDTYKIKTEYW